MTDPCSICDQPVHHLCSNDLCDPSNIAVRFCSSTCVAEWKSKNLMVTNAADDRITFETMGWSPDSSCQESSQTASSGSTEPFFCQISDATLPPDTPACVDSYGIPLDIHHSRQLGKRDNVWDVAHVLAAPYSIGNDDDAERFTHICLICAANAASQPNAAGNARETVLRRWSHTSNVKDHMVAMHESHPVGMAEVKKRTKRARRQIASVMNDVSGYISQRVTESQEPMAKRGALQKLWSPTQKELHVHIPRWLINDGLPYNTVVTKDFRNLIQRVTGTANVTILSSKTYASMLEASFQRFCAMKGIVGTSVSFINRNWDYCNLALLVTVHNGSHASSEFTMSDTTPSARKVSKLFEDSIPTDCTMHVLNLCLLYGMGMRENTEPVYVMDSATNMQKKERRVCTVGGPFPEGARLIKKVWSLNNYFNSPQRVERLTKLQFYSLPESSPIVDCDTRVASSVTLFQRTIVDYSAFRDYFRHCEKYDDPQVFDNLSEDEWELLVEMEAITGSLTDLARIEVQRSNQVESELFVLLKAAFDRLSTDKYQIYNIDADLDMPPNLDLVSSVHDELVMCGAPVPTEAPPENSMASLHDQADRVLDKWYQYTVQWVRVAVQQAPDEMLSTEDFTRLLLVRHDDSVCWRLQALAKHVDICRWYRDAGSKLFPSIAALARVWLGRSPSNAFQERVFSTGAFVMNSLRTSTDNMRAEMQVLLKHNRTENRRMEMESVAVSDYTQSA
ncbi:uncharacterized protein PITG_14162 [Phytophthora infestans T30-4]|uniref:HAT C-terminal dimerisation domain-containing protein n=1 Tax=Phytophthora infestans (strain T30-4) TaxID=403677 RepID=D0NNS0_PHYIT|nr:uncharacterized protein PITG_14162 [Phytophthora infestans T30-4]EEY62241.1 conserved hypothetical protein [Phytophthora infestans T30-4]|eukprot:XP_002899272.1 conserved hypothetical protein [Phytophthora infestans T30-4]